MGQWVASAGWARQPGVLTDWDPRLLIAALQDGQPLLRLDQLGLVQGRRILHPRHACRSDGAVALLACLFAVSSKAEAGTQEADRNRVLPSVPTSKALKKIKTRARCVGMADERAYFAEGSADENIATSLKCAVAAATRQHTTRHTHGARARARAHTHTRTYTRTHANTLTHTRTHTHVHTRARTHTHTHTNVNTHTCYM